MYYKKYHNPKCYIGDAFLEGVRLFGHSTHMIRTEIFRSILPADYYGILAGEWIREIKNLPHINPKIIVGHDPIIRPDPFYRDRDLNRIYWGVSMNYHQYIFNYKKMPPTRWKNLKNNCQLKIKPWREKGEHIVIAHKPKLSHNGKSRTPFYNKAIKAALKTGREVVLCYHPDLNKSPCYLERKLKQKFPNDYHKCTIGKGIKEYLNGAHCVISAGGSALSKAIFAGVPAFSNEPNLIDPISCKSLTEFLKKPPTPNREKWFSWVAYQQWTVPEMQKGLPWKYLVTK